ncbi:MAG: hypothetical protein F7C35_01650 [Desulfurococcales archaeon]|nr:hypothetical protein [Desulfurococcales archaeon]
MVVDIIKKIFGRGAQGRWTEWGDAPVEVGVDETPPLGAPDYDDIVLKLQYTKDELSMLKLMIGEELSKLVGEIRKAQHKGDINTAEILAADYALKRKVLHGITVLEKMLQVVITRVKTAKQMDTVRKLTSGIYPYIQSLTEYLASMSPEVAGKLMSTRDALETLYRQTQIMGETMPKNFRVSEIDPEVKEILNETFREATEEVRELAPEEPKVIDYEELEEKLLNYIKTHNGVVKLKEASKELGVPPKVIKEALYRLARKGVINLTKTGRQPQGSTA